MPKIFMIDGYQISIWSNENNEPIHVHVSKRKPSANSTKLWLLSSGKFVMANPNDRRIDRRQIMRIIRILNSEANTIRNYWIAYHGYEKYIK